MEPSEAVRIDKWLWAVRIFKSRSLATEACASGKVHIGGQPVKPSRVVKIGDIIFAATPGDILRTVKVIGLLDKRVGAKLVSGYAEDLTPESEYAKAREKSFASPGLRLKGSGRPTKKDRRKMDRFFH